MKSIITRNKILRKALLSVQSILCYSIAMSKIRKTKNIGAFVTATLAVLCALYFLAIYMFMGYGSRFFLIWAVMSVGFGVWSLILFRRAWLTKIPKWIKKILVVCVVSVAILFVIVEGMVLSQAGAKAKNGADYVIVLGAQWKSTGPSYMLRKRLEKAVDYLNENPDTVVIVSGGQGSNEHISEAEGMAGYLEAAGIESERIIKEDASTSTDENLEFSCAFLDKDTDRVVVITNDYHMFRALKLAEKKGYTHVEGLAAGSHKGMLANNLLREFFAVIKDFIMGNM